MIDPLLLFPAGQAGAALLLLRMSAASLLVASVRIFGGAPIWAWILIWLTGSSLLFGFLTRLSAVAVALAALLAAMIAGRTVGMLFGLQSVDLFALALLGPGALSIDARLYGRRIVRFDP